jgi:ribosomal protein L32
MKRSPLRRISKKRQSELREYKKLGENFLENKVCEKCGRKRKLDIHHKAGRGRFYLDVDTWMAVCRECHDYIHKWPKESREKGWLI